MTYSYENEHLYINGRWAKPHGSKLLHVVSPSTAEVIGSVPAGTVEDIDSAVAAARRAFDHTSWPVLPVTERAKYLRRAAEIFTRQQEDFAQVGTDESGIPILASRQLVKKVVTVLTYYADMADTLLLEEMRDGSANAVLVRREATGVVGIITPWNAPLPITSFSVVPALLAGCAIVLKPAPETPLYAQMMAGVFHEAGLPPGVFNVVPADREASERLVQHPCVDKISFTGSTATGRRIATICGENFRRVSLELGGKSAAIILDDADLAEVMPAVVTTALQNNGQACVGQTRILAPRARYDEIVDAFVGLASQRRVGDPHDPAVAMGPLISERQRNRVEGYIENGRTEGAKLALGGGRPAHLNRGWYVEPTVFRNVDNQMKIAREEIFGPVVSIISYDGENEAVAISNDTVYGLSGTVWTGDQDRGVAVARRIRAGNLGVNAFGLDVVAPFGGFKQSGIGRQLGPEGLQGFFEYKAIHLPPAAFATWRAAEPAV